LPALAKGKVALSWGSVLGLKGLVSFVPMVLVLGALAARLVWVYGHVPEGAVSTAEEPVPITA
jgi:hypothetical protein